NRVLAQYADRSCVVVGLWYQAIMLAIRHYFGGVLEERVLADGLEGGQGPVFGSSRASDAEAQSLQRFNFAGIEWLQKQAGDGLVTRAPDKRLSVRPVRSAIEEANSVVDGVLKQNAGHLAAYFSVGNQVRYQRTLGKSKVAV